MKQPLISVITVSYNAAATIEQTMLSVLNPNVEYIVINDGSTDGTGSLIRNMPITPPAIFPTRYLRRY